MVSFRDLSEEDHALYRAHRQRCEARARAALKAGDRIRVTRCGGAAPTYTFVGFDGDKPWMMSKSGADDLAPSCVIAVNGVPTSFWDDPKAHLANPRPSLSEALGMIRAGLARFSKFQNDFDAMSDDDVADTSRRMSDQLDEAEEWLEAVAAWEEAGRPRSLLAPQG